MVLRYTMRGYLSPAMQPQKATRQDDQSVKVPNTDCILWYSTELLLAGYLVLSCKRGTPLTTFLPATTGGGEVEVVS